MGFKIEIVSQREAIKSSRGRWFRQYQQRPDEEKAMWSDKTFGDIRVALNALNLETCSADDVKKAIDVRHGSWVAFECGACESTPDPIARLGYDLDVYLCGKCLAETLGKFFG